MSKFIEGPVIPVRVRYDRPLSSAIAAAHFRGVHPLITARRFPVGKTRPPEHLAVRLIGVESDTVDSAGVLGEMARQGCRAITLLELLSLASRRPYFHPKGSVVALGSVWRDANDIPQAPAFTAPQVPSGFRADVHRRLQLISLIEPQCGWVKGDWFACVSLQRTR
jgi:hypothetical protein